MSPESGKQKDASSFASTGLLHDPEGSPTSQRFLVQPGSQVALLGVLLREEEGVKNNRAGEKSCSGRG